MLSSLSYEKDANSNTDIYGLDGAQQIQAFNSEALAFESLLKFPRVS